VDLRTGEFLGPATPDQFVTQMCPVEYDPNVDMQPAIDFFERLFPKEEYPDYVDLVRFMQRFPGYGLTGETNLQYCLYVYCLDVGVTGLLKESLQF
jgi:phage/plasmid-associated DNA primase